MNIVSKELSPAIALDYWVDTLMQIEVGGADVTRTLLGGSMCTLVPADLPDDRVYDFKHGGILPVIDRNAGAHSTVQPVASTAEFLARQLVKLDGLDCVIHDPLKDIGDASPADGEPMLIEGSLFYLNKHFFRSVSECQKIVRRNTLSWHFLMFAGAYPNPMNLSRNSLFANAALIVAGAYDGESYLVWHPSNPTA